MSRPRPRTSLMLRCGALAAAGLIGLTGCTLSPGVAVEVDGTTITDDRIDELASATCEALGPGLEGPVPVASVKAAMIQALVNEQLAQDVAQRYDVGPGQQFGETLRATAQSLPDLPDDVRDDYLAFFRSATYAQQIFGAAAAAEVERSGGDPADQEALARTAEGLSTLAARDADITVDPRYGVSYVDGVLTPDEGVSVPVSDAAVGAAGALTGQADPTYVDSLPAAQVCEAG